MSSLQSLLSTLLFALALPTQTHAASITFCNEPDLDPPCTTDTIGIPKYGCHLIPDSNAKGDYNSSLLIANNDNYHIDRCYLYSDESCQSLTKDEWIEVNADETKTLDRQWIARSYECFETWDLVLPCERAGAHCTRK